MIMLQNIQRVSDDMRHRVMCEVFGNIITPLQYC